jgi:hypothetical protein
MNEKSDLQADLSRLLKERPPYINERFSPAYNDFLVIFAARRVVVRYYSQTIGDCPKLSKVDSGVYAKLIRGEIDIQKTSNIVAAVIAVGLLPACIMAIASTSEPALLLGPFFIIIADWLLWVHAFRKDSEARAARELFFVVRALEKYAEYWNEPDFRKMVAEHLEHAAVLVSSIPWSIRGLAPEVRRDLFAASEKKAQALRVLELAIIKADSVTYANLVNRLLENFIFLAKGQWYELPESEYKHTASRRTIIAWIGGAVLFTGAAIVIIAFFPRLASAASILSTIISIVIMIVISRLNQEGLSVDLLEQYADISQKLTRNS